jgi:hypothetical protein
VAVRHSKRSGADVDIPSSLNPEHIADDYLLNKVMRVGRLSFGDGQRVSLKTDATAIEPLH